MAIINIPNNSFRKITLSASTDYSIQIYNYLCKGSNTTVTFSSTYIINESFLYTNIIINLKDGLPGDISIGDTYFGCEIRINTAISTNPLFHKAFVIENKSLNSSAFFGGSTHRVLVNLQYSGNSMFYLGNVEDSMQEQQNMPTNFRIFLTTLENVSAVSTGTFTCSFYLYLPLFTRYEQ